MISKKHEMKTFEWIIFSNPLKARGLHPGCTSGVPNESSTPKDRMLISKHKLVTEHRFLKYKAKTVECAKGG
jgi:hypothetical protein